MPPLDPAQSRFWSVLGASGSFFNLQELPVAYIQPPGAFGELLGAILTAVITNKQFQPVEFDVLVPFMKVSGSNSTSLIAA